MKEEQDKWIEGFRNRMEGYSEPVPDRLWEQLSAEWGSRRVPFRARWRRAAAVAALVVLSSFSVWLVRRFSDAPGEEGSGRPAVLTEALCPAGGESAVAEEETVSRQPIAMARMRSRKPAVLPEPLDEAAAASLESEEDKTEPDTGKEAATPEQKENRAETPRRTARNGYALAAFSGRRSRSWEVGVAVGNVPVAASRTVPGYASLPRPKQQDGGLANDPAFSVGPSPDGSFSGVSGAEGSGETAALNRILSNNVRNAVFSEVRHRAPVTFGISVRWHWNKRWACETGLSYTRLSSEIRAGGDSYYYETEQRLHYVGIPVRVSCNVWEKGRLSLYAAAGGAVEKCVSGRTETVYTAGNEQDAPGSADLTVKPLQWSVSAAAGVQFKLSKRVGVYAEPGMAYYFDDGSEVQTLRKEHPFHFNLQFGIRLSY